VSTLRVDHIVWAVDDLDAAAVRFRDEFGLDSVAGGRHRDWGTANRIVPLGSEYLELVTVADRERAARSDFGRAVLAGLAVGRELIGWAAATDDLPEIAARLDLDVVRGSRTRPDGSTLRWRLAGVAPALSTGALPFFIQWDVSPGLRPGAAAAEHRATPSAIAWLGVAADGQEVEQWLGDDSLPLRISDGVRGLRAVALDTAAGELVLPTNAGRPQ
jgi:hypothetical protein